MKRRTPDYPWLPDPQVSPGVVETLEAIRSAKMTSLDAVEACRQWALAINPDLAAFTVVNEAPFHSNPSLPLDGIAVGVKDLYDTAELPTAYGSAIYRDHRPEGDAKLVAELIALGAFVAGKTVTTEFAWRKAGPTLNPFNPKHTPGGSSSGSAAAVAAGVVPLALGTQTFGSVIRPAAFCGVVGFKPTHAVLPLQGVHPLSPTLDHAGYFARSVGDIGLVHELIMKSRQSPSDIVAKPRLRVVKTPYWEQASTRQQAALQNAADLLGQCGFSITMSEMPAEFDSGPVLAETILCHEAAALYRVLIDKFPDLVSHHIKELVIRGERVSSFDYHQAIAKTRDLKVAFEREMQEYDAILTLPALGEAPLLVKGTGDPAPCVLWTLLGTPTVAMPWGFGAAGLPLGIQLVGKAGEDFRLLNICAAIQQTIL